MKERPFVVFVCCFLAGASVPSLWHGFAQALVLGGILLVLAGCGMAGLLTGRLAAACLAALLLGWTERTGAERYHHSELSVAWEKRGIPELAEAAGTIVSRPETDGDSVSFRMAAVQWKDMDSGKMTAIREQILVRVRLKNREELAVAGKWKRGDSVGVTGTPELPGEAGNFGAFDYRKYLRRQAVHWQWSVRGTEAVTHAKKAVPWHMLPLLGADELRSGIGRLMDRLYPHGDAGYMKGLVAGISDEVDPAQYDAFSRLGLTHVLAISGLHVGVIVFTLLRLGALLRLTRERSIDITIAAMPVYMLVTGASPSAVRACMMAMIALALARRHRLKDGLHLLAAAALVMVMWDPFVVENVSFQLSFAVTAGLLLFTRTVSGLLAAVPGKLAREALAVGLTAQAVSFPLTVYYFNGFHLLSLPANLLLVPFISFVVMPLGMASVVLGAVWFPLGMLPARLAAFGNRLTFELVELLDGAQRLRTIWPEPSKLWVLSAYVLLGISMWHLHRRNIRKENDQWQTRPEMEETAPLGEHRVSPSKNWKPRAGAAAALIVFWVIWLAWGYRPALLDRHAAVQFLDVGQGDGILIRTGTGKHVLVDTGGTVHFRKPGEEWRDRRDPYDIGRKLLVPLLRRRGVRELDALVLTHLDADHIGGAEAVLREVPVRALIWNGTWRTGEGARRLFRAALERGIPVYAAKRGLEWNIDATSSMQVLFPDTEPASVPVVEKQNQNSVVLLMTLYGRRFLLTGDIDAAGEAQIIGSRRSLQPGRRLDVMKAAHHGSKTSTSGEWLDWWRPAEVVVSAGRRNVYGHPHPTVVERISAAGGALFRTDRDGEVQYRVTPGGRLQRREKFGGIQTPSP